MKMATERTCGTPESHEPPSSLEPDELSPAKMTTTCGVADRKMCTLPLPLQLQPER